MSNTTGNDRLFQTPWTLDRMLRINAAVPGSNTTFYSGQAVGRDGSGNMVQMDDTARAEFIGVLIDMVRTEVLSSDSVGDKVFDVTQPQQITALIAAAAAGDEGRPVYWKYNNEVSYSPGTYANFAGWVWQVKDSTHVVITPPWMGSYREGITNRIADPGNAGAIPVTRSGHVPIVTAAAETRTLAVPTFPGQELLLYMKTDGGDCVITSAQGINQAGNTSITMNDAGDTLRLHAIQSGANLRWRTVVNDGCTLA